MLSHENQLDFTVHNNPQHVARPCPGVLVVTAYDLKLSKRFPVVPGFMFPWTLLSNFNVPFIRMLFPTILRRVMLLTVTSTIDHSKNEA
jgi:hypothetical protein